MHETIFVCVLIIFLAAISLLLAVICRFILILSNYVCCTNSKYLTLDSNKHEQYFPIPPYSFLPLAFSHNLNLFYHFYLTINSVCFHFSIRALCASLLLATPTATTYMHLKNKPLKWCFFLYFSPNHKEKERNTILLKVLVCLLSSYYGICTFNSLLSK